MLVICSGHGGQLPEDGLCSFLKMSLEILKWVFKLKSEAFNSTCSIRISARLGIVGQQCKQNPFGFRSELLISLIMLNWEWGLINETGPAFIAVNLKYKLPSRSDQLKSSTFLFPLSDPRKQYSPLSSISASFSFRHACAPQKFSVASKQDLSGPNENQNRTFFFNPWVFFLMFCFVF